MALPVDVDQRQRDLRGLILNLKDVTVLGSFASVEDAYLMQDSARAYLHGADAASIFCSHAVCERGLAVWTEHTKFPPNGYLYWGLGKFVGHVKELGAMPEDLVADLSELNNVRKSVYHWGRTNEPDALTDRVHKRMEQRSESFYFEEAERLIGSVHPREVYQLVFDIEMKDSALQSLNVSWRLAEWERMTDPRGW